MLIPSGATNVDIKEQSPSNNYLAIRNGSNHYYLNGNWQLDFPRPLTFAGAIWHYERRPQGFAAPDHISCLGPTNENVYLVGCSMFTFIIKKVILLCTQLNFFFT